MGSNLSKLKKNVMFLGLGAYAFSLSGCFEVSEGIRRYEGMEHEVAIKYLTPFFKEAKNQMYSFSIKGSKDWCKSSDLELSNKVLSDAAKNPKVKKYYRALEAYVGSNFAMSSHSDLTEDRRKKYLNGACEGIELAYKQVNIDVRACHKSLVLDPHNPNLVFPSGFHTTKQFENLMDCKSN